MFEGLGFARARSMRREHLSLLLLSVHVGQMPVRTRLSTWNVVSAKMVVWTVAAYDLGSGAGDFVWTLFSHWAELLDLARRA